MKHFDIYISLIFTIKIGFIIMSLTHLYLKIKGKTDSELDKKIIYWKEKLEFVFIFLMSALLMYLFNPRKSHIDIIDSESKLLLFLFGFILIFTADWSNFLKEI
jgi:hypothetical protein